MAPRSGQDARLSRRPGDEKQECLRGEGLGPFSHFYSDFNGGVIKHHRVTQALPPVSRRLLLNPEKKWTTSVINRLSLNVGFAGWSCMGNFAACDSCCTYLLYSRFFLTSEETVSLGRIFLYFSIYCFLSPHIHCQ